MGERGNSGRWFLASTIISLIAAIGYNGYRSWEDHQLFDAEAEIPVGLLCDQVAAETQKPVTYGWYRACVYEAARLKGEMQ